MGFLFRLLLRLLVPTIAVGAATLGAAYSGLFDVDGPLSGTPFVGPDSLTARLPFVDDGLVTLDTSVEGAADLLAAVPVDGTGVGLTAWSNAAASLASAGMDAGDLLVASDRAQVLAVARDEAVITALRAEGEALAGGTRGNTKPVEAADPLRAFFVNGIMNTARDAEAGRLALQQALGADVTLYYNHSSVETAELRADFCRRALGLDARAAGSGESPLSTAVCRGAEGVTEALSTLLEAGRGAVEVSAMRVFGQGSFFQSVAAAGLASQAVNDELVADVQAAVEAGAPVVLIGHSQGTMFVSNALQQTQAWWDGLLAEGRACGSNPATALYVSPAFDAVTTANERYVELPNDLLLVTGVTGVQPTVELYGPQAHMNPLDLHSLSTYLLPRSNSRGDIERKFALLADYARAHAGAVVLPPGVPLTSTVPVTGEGGVSVPAGGSATFDLRLPCRPESPVTLRIAVVTGGGPVTASPAVIEVTPRDWQEPLTITVRAAADAPLGDAVVGIATGPDGSNPAGARDALVTVSVTALTAGATGERARAEGTVDLQAGLRAALDAGLELATAAMPAESRATIRDTWPMMVEQVMGASSTEVNRLVLEYPADGGAVTGVIGWGFEFAPPVAPGLPACVVASAMRGDVAGEFDAASGRFAGTIRAESEVRVEGCGGTIAPIPPPAGSDLEWSAVLDGRQIRGEIRDGSSGRTVVTPFTATVQ